MSVRRLAEASVQPPSFAFSNDNAAWAEATIRKYPDGRQQSAVIPLLMRAQEQEGWVTKAAIEAIAGMLAMPLIRVLEVATFYTQFQLKPVGTRAHIQVCGTTPCMLRGSDELKAVCRSRIHEEQFHLNEAGTLSWEEVECLGACVNAPMVMVFQDTYEDLTPERLAEIIDAFEAGRGAEIEPGPQNGRHLSAPIGGLTTLTDEYDDRTPPRAAAGTPSSGAPAASGPSQAGRLDTHAAETDPTIAGPGKAAPDESVSPRVERETSERLVEEASRPGAGREGGTFEGETGAAEKDAEAFGTTPSDAGPGDARTEGRLRDQEAEAGDAVILDGKLVDNPEGTKTEPAGTARNRTAGGEPFEPVVEGRRKTTSDTASEPAGPAKTDDDAAKN